MQMIRSRVMIILTLQTIISARAVSGKQMFGASLPTRSMAQWSVESRRSQEEEEASSSEQHHCLILSGNFSVIFVHDNENPELMNEDMKRLHWRVDIPKDADAHGNCEDQQTEVTLRWRGGEEGEDRNLLNIVLSKKGRLVDLTGVFVRLHREGGRHELTSKMAQGEKEVLSWPYRYSLTCPRTLYYPLYAVARPARKHQGDLAGQTDLKDNPEAFIIIENLMMEVFREETSISSESSESLSKQFVRRGWECEFHYIRSWAPPVVGGTLAFLVLAMIFSFFFKSCLGCSDYPRKRGSYQKI